MRRGITAGLTVLVVAMIAILTPRPAAAKMDVVVLAYPEETQRSPSGKDKLRDFLVDLVTAAFNRSGHTFEIRFMPWGRCLEELRYSRVDAAFPVLQTTERLHDFDFSGESLAGIQQSMFAGKDRHPALAQDLKGLSDLRVGIVNYTVHGETLDRALKPNHLRGLVMARDYDHLVTLLASGRIDVAIGSKDAIAGAIEGLHMQDKIDELPLSLDLVPSYIAYSKARDLTQVRHDLDRALKEIKNSSTYNDLWRKTYP